MTPGAAPTRLVPSRHMPLLAALAAIALVWAAPAGIGARPESPATRALRFLAAQQLREPLDAVVSGARVRDFPGDWPQYFNLQGAGIRVRDVSPFMVAFVHHALTQVVEGNRSLAGLGPEDLSAARAMRQRAAWFMRLFAAAPGAPDAGTYAFWPYDADPATPDLFTTLVLTAWLKGPILGGQRAPLNLPIYPTPLAIPSDADVTATTYAVLLDDARLDGGPGTSVRFERLFVDWRDYGIVPRRFNPSWLPPASGAFLTWLTYRQSVFPLFPNDVDLAVNANVLYALARHGRLGTPGVADAVALIDLAVAMGLHRDRMREVSDYYPDNVSFQYLVTRAFRQGPVPALAPAVAILADDLETTGRMAPDGTVYWDHGDPPLNTAFAVLALLNAGRDTPLVDRAIEYLEKRQGADGAFPEATFFEGRTYGGQVFEFSSASFTTAMALEAFVRHDVEHCGRAAHACR
jgi:hypothetical protein